jgi:hypothetical protein
MEPSDPQAGKVQPLHATEAAEQRLLWRRFHQAESREAFHASWLAIQCQLIDRVEAGLLLVRSRRSGAFESAARWPVDRRPGAHVRAAADRVLRARKAQALQLDPQDGGRKRTIVARPVEIDGEIEAVVVLDVAPRPERQLEEALRQLAWGCGWLELTALRGASSQAQTTLLELIATPLEHARFRAAATAFVTELATRFDCDRVSLAVIEDESARLVALSHSAQFDRRSNLARALEAAMEEAVDQGREIVLPVEADSAGVVTRAHEALVAEAELGAVGTFLFAREEHFCGAVSSERSGGPPFSEAELDLMDVAVEMAGPVLDLQRREDRSIAVKLREVVRGRLADLIGPRHVGLKLTAGMLVLLVAFLVLAKGDYRVTADLSLEARLMRAAVAPFDGYLLEAPARAGDLVAEGDVLAVLDDRDLALERARFAAQLQELDQQYREALGERDAPNVRILSARIEKVRAQFDLAEDHLARTRIVAPFDGIVVSGDRSQELGSPIERGELLFEVAPLDDYRAVLLVDERDVADVVVGQQGQLVFSAFPEAPVAFTIEQLTPVATASEGRNSFRVEATLAETPERLRPGLEGVAKIDVDRRRLIWIWTRRAVDWLRLTLWSWLP